MQEELITFETAKIAKEKGFNWDVVYHYGLTDKNDKEHVTHAIGRITHDWNNSGFPHWISAPSQSLLQKWLRETHKIHIHVLYIDDTDEYSSYVNNKVIYIHFKSYEEALEAGLREGLKQL